MDWRGVTWNWIRHIDDDVIDEDATGKRQRKKTDDGSALAKRKKKTATKWDMTMNSIINPFQNPFYILKSPLA